MQGSMRLNATKPILCTGNDSPPKVDPKLELKIHKGNLIRIYCFCLLKMSRTNPVVDLPRITEVDNRRNHGHMAAVKIGLL